MLGRAVFTTVMSSSSMNVAIETAIRVHHFRLMWNISGGRGTLRQEALSGCLTI
jgi:hypothetical protein